METPDIQEMVYIRDRLTNNVIGYIQEFSKSVDWILGLENNYKDLKAEIPRLLEDRARLVSDIEKLEQNIIDSQRAHGELMRKQMEVAMKDQQELTAKTHLMQSKLSQLEEMHTKRMAEVEKEYDKRLDELRVEVAREEERLKVAKGGIAALKAATERL